MPQLSFTLTQQQYEALIAFAREGTKDGDGQVLSEKASQLDSFLRLIEEENDVTRDAVWIQWQNASEPLPPTTNFPSVWPPENRFYIEFISTPDNVRKVSRADVDIVLDQKARDPQNVLVTKDPGANVGWTPVDDFFK